MKKKLFEVELRLASDDCGYTSIVVAASTIEEAMIGALEAETKNTEEDWNEVEEECSFPGLVVSGVREQGELDYDFYR